MCCAVLKDAKFRLFSPFYILATHFIVTISLILHHLQYELLYNLYTNMHKQSAKYSPVSLVRQIGSCLCRYYQLCVAGSDAQVLSELAKIPTGNKVPARFQDLSEEGNNDEVSGLGSCLAVHI